MEIKTKLVPITWLPTIIPHGYGCGYIGVPPEHPWYGKHYDDLPNVGVHGGLTYSNNNVNHQLPDGYWWIGFDTAHYGDNIQNCDEQYCLHQIELLKLQEWLRKTGKTVIIVFEGRDSAGKGSTIKKFTEHLNPRYYNVIALGVPTPEDRKDWWNRYKREIKPGMINFLDRKSTV